MSRINVHRNVLLGFRVFFHEFLKMMNCFRCQENVRAYITDFCRNIIKYNHVRSSLHHMQNKAVLVFPRTSLDTAFHFYFPLSNGVTHLGGFGSYTVMIMATSRDVVITTCTYFLCKVFPQTRQHEPLLCSV